MGVLRRTLLNNCRPGVTLAGTPEFRVTTRANNCGYGCFSGCGGGAATWYSELVLAGTYAAMGCRCSAKSMFLSEDSTSTANPLKGAESPGKNSTGGPSPRMGTAEVT